MARMDGILRTLNFNARISNRDLAEEVGLSTTPCWNRVRNLEEKGVITQYVTIFDQQKIGMPDTVIIEVTLERHDADILEKFGAALTDLPEVTEAYLVTGDYDYLIKAAVSGTSGYERFLRDRLYKIPGIRHTRSSFALRCLKQSYTARP
jgi:Lrp/AsnC family transcriptional regulator, leucine-responsive regulatory protein